MAKDAKADEFLDALRASFADSLQAAALDLPAHQVLQLADALCGVQLEVLAGMRVRYQPLPEVDAEAITDAWRKGASLGEVKQRFRISRATAYRYHPNRAARRAKQG
jgi:hypothetical protein